MKLKLKLLIVLVFATFSFTKVVNGSTISDFFQKSYIFEEKRDYTSAIENVMPILNINSRNYTALLRLGWLYYLNLDNNKSVEFYKKALSIENNSIEPLIGMTLPLMALRNWKELEKISKIILTKDPANYYANARLAYALFSQAKYGEAKSRYELVLKLYPSDLEMKLGLAWTYLKMGNTNKAREIFNNVLEISKNNINAQIGLKNLQ